MMKLQPFRRIEGIKGQGENCKHLCSTYAEIVLRVEDSLLVHMCSCNPETVWDTLTQVHCACGLIMWLALQKQLLTLFKNIEEAMLV